MSKRKKDKQSELFRKINKFDRKAGCEEQLLSVDGSIGQRVPKDLLLQINSDSGVFFGGLLTIILFNA